MSAVVLGMAPFLIDSNSSWVKSNMPVDMSVPLGLTHQQVSSTAGRHHSSILQDIFAPPPVHHHGPSNTKPTHWSHAGYSVFPCSFLYPFSKHLFFILMNSFREVGSRVILLFGYSDFQNMFCAASSCPNLIAATLAGGSQWSLSGCGETRCLV